MQVDRQELLQYLLAVEPGLSSRGSTQCNCVALKMGRLYTFCEELACSCPSGLDVGMECAIEAAKFMDLLKQMPDDNIKVEVGKKYLLVEGSGRRGKVAMQAEILLPIDSIERPKKEQWVKLDDNLLEAIDLTRSCTKKKGSIGQTFVHLTPGFLEASDVAQYIRCNVETFVSSSVFCRGESLGQITELGMTKGAETENWLHFRNPMGLRVSVRKFSLEEYPELEGFLDQAGVRVVFPKGLTEAAGRANIFPNDDGSVLVELDKNTLTISGRNESGEYEEDAAIKYAGDNIKFLIPPKLLGKLAEQHSECEITESALRVNGEFFTYLVGLELKG